MRVLEKQTAGQLVVFLVERAAVTRMRIAMASGSRCRVQRSGSSARLNFKVHGLVWNLEPCTLHLEPRASASLPELQSGPPNRGLTSRAVRAAGCRAAANSSAFVALPADPDAAGHQALRLRRRSAEVQHHVRSSFSTSHRRRWHSVRSPSQRPQALRHGTRALTARVPQNPAVIVPGCGARASSRLPTTG